jgi:hypothetical protein
MSAMVRPGFGFSVAFRAVSTTEFDCGKFQLMFT